MRILFYIVSILLLGGTGTLYAASIAIDNEQSMRSTEIVSASWEQAAEHDIWNQAVMDRLFTDNKLPLNARAVDAYATIHAMRQQLFGVLYTSIKHGQTNNGTAGITAALLRDITEVDITPLSQAEHDLLSQDWITVVSVNLDDLLSENCPPEHKQAFACGYTLAINQKRGKTISCGKMSYTDLFSLTAQKQNLTRSLFDQAHVDYYSLFLYIWEDNPGESCTQTDCPLFAILEFPCNGLISFHARQNLINNLINRHILYTFSYIFHHRDHREHRGYIRVGFYPKKLCAF